MDQPSSTRKAWKRLLVWAAIGLPLVAIGFATWQMQRLRTRAPDEVARVLGAAFGGEATVREASLDLARAGLVIRGIEVHSGSRTLFIAAEVFGRPSIRALLAGRLQLQTLSIPAAAIHLQTEDLRRMGREGAGRLVASISVAELRLALELAPHGTVEVEHGALTTSAARDGRTDIELTAPRIVWKSAAGATRAQSRVSLRGQWSRANPAAAASGAGQLQLAALQVAGRAVTEPVDLEWRVRGEHWALDTPDKPGERALSVHAELDPPAARLRLGWREVEIDQLLELAGQTAPMLFGALAGEVELTGTLWPLALAGSSQLTAQRLRVLAPSSGSPPEPSPKAQRSVALEIPQLTAAGDLRLTASDLHVDGLRIGLGRSQLSGHAAVTALGEVETELRGADVDLAYLGAVWGFGVAGHGLVTLSARLGQTASAARASLSLDAAAIGGKQLGRFTADLALDPATGRLLAEHATANGAERQLSADGSALDFDATGLVRARARLRVLRLPLRELYQLLGAADDPVLARLQGSAAGTADVVYGSASVGLPSAQNPSTPISNVRSSAMDLVLALQLSEIDLAGYAFDRGSLAAHIAIPDRTRGLAAGTLALSQLRLNAARGTLELSGELVRNQLDMKLGLSGLPLERAPWLRSRSRVLLTGIIDGRGRLGGEASSTRADLQLGLDGLRLLGEPLGRIQLQAQLRTTPESDSDGASACRESRDALTTPAFRGASTWLLCGDGLDGHLHVDLAVSNANPRAIRGNVALTEFALGPFLHGLQPSAAADANHSNRLSATLELTGGGLADPERLSAALRVRKLALGAGETQLENTAPFELRVRQGVLELENAKLSGPILHFAVGATGTLGKDARLTADGEIPASIFTRDSEPLVKAFGNVGVHLEWSPGAQPALRGRAELHELAIRGPASVQLHRVRGALALSGDRLALEGVEADLGGGKVGAAGHLELDGLRVCNYDFAIEAERVALEPEALIQLELDAKTQLTWRGAAALPDLSGNVIIRRLAYGKPLHLEALAAMNRARAAPTARDRVTLDLTVEQRAPLRVRNTLLDGELSITGADRKLRVVGTDQHVGVLGELAVTRGRLLFQGDQFHFTRGDIALRDPARIAPRFDVRAVADQPKRQDTSVVLSAQGTRDAFKVAIQCDAGAVAVDAPPFTCDYAHDRMSCDDFDRLVAQWSCPTKRAGPNPKH